MDLSRKTIQNLTVSLDRRREDLSSFYLEFGRKLLSDSFDPSIMAGALSTERIENWRSLLVQREADTQAILNIKAAVTRQLELTNFRKELDKNLLEENKRYKEQLEELGRIFYSQYTEKDALVFGEIYEKASVEGNKLLQLESKQEKLQQDLRESGFFGKMFAQLKMAGLASNIRQQKSRVYHILSDGAETLLLSGVLEKSVGEGKFDSNFTENYYNTKTILTGLDTLKKRAETIESDLTMLNDDLTAFEALRNPLSRIDELHLKIKETDKRIDTLTILSAREYSDKFLDENGGSLLGNTGDGHTFSDMGSYSHQLEQIALHRSEISLIRRKIEILETSFKIEAIDKNISSYERTITDYENKIKHFQELSDILHKNIRESTEERLNLMTYKESVEKAL